MLKEKLTDEEAWLWFVLQSPSLSAEFFWSDDSGNALRLWKFQWDFFDNEYDREFSFCARYVSKSWCAASRMFTFPFREPGETMFVTAAEGMHLDTLLTKFDTEVENSYIHQAAFGRVRIKPFYKRIAFNNAKIFARVPQRTGRGVKSIHAKEIIADEYQDFTPKAKSELIEVYKKASRRFISGVPETKSDPVIRKMTRNSRYKTWKFPRMKNPDWDDFLREEKIAEYGGEDTAEYRRNVYGEPVEELYSIFKKRILYSLVDTNTESPINKVYESEIYREEQTPENDVVFAPLNPQFFPRLYMGIDLGWVDAPTTIIIFGYTDAKYYLVRLYRLYRYEEPEKVRILKRAINFFDPILIGVDSSGAGTGTYQTLKAFSPKVYGIDVRKKIKVTKDKEVYWNDLSIDLVLQLVEKRKLVLPFDEELVKDWASASIEKSGERKVYSKGLHSLDAAKAIFSAIWIEKGGVSRQELQTFQPKVIKLSL